MIDNVHISWSVRPDCYNMQAYCYGICHGCGCCSKKKPDRWENRLRYLQEELEDQEHFDRWDEDTELRALQEKNVKANIKYLNRRIGIYKGLLKKYRAKSNDNHSPVKVYENGDDTWTCSNCAETVGWLEPGKDGMEAVKYNFCPCCGRELIWNASSKD